MILQSRMLEEIVLNEQHATFLAAETTQYSVGLLVHDRMWITPCMREEYSRFYCIGEHRDRLANVIRDAFMSCMETGKVTTAKVSAPADRVGSSILHYIKVQRWVTEIQITVRSVISDSKE